MSKTPEQIARALKRRWCRLWKLHPTSYPYLSGDLFRSLARHIYDMDSSIIPHTVKEKDIVFVQSSRIDDFIENIHPKIAVPYILITHNADQNITEKYRDFLAEPTLIHWFAQNCLIEDPKITPLPIGLENRWYHQHGEPTLFNFFRRRTASKKSAILYKFNVKSNPAAREPVARFLATYPLAETYEAWTRPRQYLSYLEQYQFVASPPGNGEDCIRTWEAMYLKTVPIVQRSPMTSYFADLGLPLVVIEDWMELQAMSKTDLEQLYQKHADSFSSPVLFADYWISLIKSQTL